MCIRDRLQAMYSDLRQTYKREPFIVLGSIRKGFFLHPQYPTVGIYQVNLWVSFLLLSSCYEAPFFRWITDVTVFNSPATWGYHFPSPRVDLVCPMFFLCVQTTIWLPMLRIFNVCTIVNACDCPRELYRHHKRVCTESWMREKFLAT